MQFGSIFTGRGSLGNCSALLRQADIFSRHCRLLSIFQTLSKSLSKSVRGPSLSRSSAENSRSRNDRHDRRRISQSYIGEARQRRVRLHRSNIPLIVGERERARIAPGAQPAVGNRIPFASSISGGRVAQQGSFLSRIWRNGARGESGSAGGLVRRIGQSRPARHQAERERVSKPSPSRAQRCPQIFTGYELSEIDSRPQLTNKPDINAVPATVQSGSVALPSVLLPISL